MSAFLVDDFTDTDGTTLTSHTGITGGTWTLPGSESTVTAQISDDSATAGAVRFGMRQNSATSGTGHYLSSGTPASADYEIHAIWKIITVPSVTGGGFGMTLRTDSTCANCYLVQYVPSSADWNIYKKVAGTFTSIATAVAVTLVAGTYLDIVFKIVGTQIDFIVDGASVFSLTDSAVSATGKVGIRWGAHPSGGSATTHIHIYKIIGDAVGETALRSIGDSITVGYKASPQATNRWAQQLAVAETWNDYCRGQASTQIIDMCSDDRVKANNQVYLPFAPATTDRFCWIAGYNDLRFNGSDANALETFNRVLRAAIAWLTRLPADVFQMNNGIWTPTGSWTGAVINGIINSKYTTTNGDKITGSVSGTAITVAYLSRFGLADASASITVKIDGVSQTVIDATFGTASGFTSYGAGAGRYVPMAMRYSGLSSGAHTVEISHTGTAGKICQLLFVVGTGGSAGAGVYIADPIKVTNWNLGSPYNVGTDAALTSYSNTIGTLISDCVSDGYAPKHVLTNSYFVTGTDEDADGIHPTGTGYTHIENAFDAAINPASAGGGPIYGTGVLIEGPLYSGRLAA